MTFLLGRQATLGQAPPMRLSSMLMTCCPCEPRCQAIHLPDSPLPMMIASYCSGVDMRISVRLDIETATSFIRCGSCETGLIDGDGDRISRRRGRCESGSLAAIG